MANVLWCTAWDCMQQRSIQKIVASMQLSFACMQSLGGWTGVILVKPLLATVSA